MAFVGSSCVRKQGLAAWLRLQKRRKVLPEFRHFRPNHMHAVSLVGITGEILLVVRLRLKPLACRRHFRNNRVGIEALLSDVCEDTFGDVLLFRRVIKDGRSILGPAVIALPVKRGRIMDGKKYVQQVTVGDHVRVEGDPYRFGMAGLPSTYLFIGRRRGLPAHVS